MDIANQLTADISRAIGKEIPDDNRIEIAEWQRGRNLASIPPHARAEIFAMLQEYVIQFTDNLIALKPSSPKHELVARHALAQAAAVFVKKFEEDFERLIELKTPGLVRNYVGQIPGESL